MNKKQVETVNVVNELVLAPLSIIPTITTKHTKRIYYKDVVTQKRYAVKVEGNVFNVREDIGYRFGSRTIFRTIDDDKKLASALSDFKDYVLKQRKSYIKMMNHSFGTAVDNLTNRN